MIPSSLSQTMEQAMHTTPRVIYSHDMERELRDGEWGQMLLKNIEKNGQPSSLGIRCAPSLHPSLPRTS